MTLDKQLKKFWRYGVLDLDAKVGKYLTWNTWDKVPEQYKKDFQYIVDHARTDCCSASLWLNGRNYSLHREGTIQEAQRLQPRTKGNVMVMYICRNVWKGVHPTSQMGRWEEPSVIRAEEKRAIQIPRVKPKAEKKAAKVVSVGEMISDFSDLL